MRTGTYTASVNGDGVQFSNNGGQTSSSGVFINGTPQTTFQDAGFANGGALSGFTFTLTNSKMEANQAEAGTFKVAWNQFQAGLALEKARLVWMGPVGVNWGSDEFRSWGTWTGANSAHFNVDRAKTDPWSSPLAAPCISASTTPCKIRSTTHTRRRSELVPKAN